MSRDTSSGRATVRQLCAVFRVSRQAYYEARRSSERGPTKPRRERRGPWVSDAELIAGIKAIVAENPAWGTRKVWASLRRGGVTASQRRVWKRMQALGLVLPGPGHVGAQETYGHVSVADSNRRWGTDLTTVYTKHDGFVALVPVVDFGDRSALACRVTKSQMSGPVIAATEKALLDQFGDAAAVPDGLEWRTDHGPQFTGSDSDAFVDLWGLQHTFSPVGRPTGNAITERFILTLKIELLWTRDWASIDEVQQAVDKWLVLYNEQRPHQALSWRTPAEQRALNLNTQPRRMAA